VSLFSSRLASHRDAPGPEMTHDFEAADLFGRATRGVLWLSGVRVLDHVLGLAVKIVLARLLAPGDFGLVAMALVVTSFLRLFVDLGLTAALVQRRDRIGDVERSTAFWLIAAVALLATVVLWPAAPLVAAFFAVPALSPVLRAMSVVLILAVPETAYGSLLQRDLQFRLLALRSIAATVVAGGISLALATRGAGVWALVAYTMIGAGMRSTLLMLAGGWYPRLLFSPAVVGELWRFGRFQMGAQFLNYVSRHFDNLLVGRFLGSAALGYYALAYQGVALPFLHLSQPVATVLFPAFCRIGDDRARLNRAYLAALQMLIAATWPLGVLAALLAPHVIPAVLGSKWAPVAPLFAILSLAAVFQSTTGVSSQLLKSVGAVRAVFRLQGLATALLSIGIGVGLAWGIRGVALGVLAASALFLPFQINVVRRYFGISGSELARQFARGAATAGAAALPWLVAALVHSGDLPIGLVVGNTLGSLVLVTATYRWLLGDAWRMGLRILSLLGASWGRGRGDGPMEA